MVECELCGSKATRKAKVEGVILNVCEDCVKFGEEIPTIEFKKTEKKIPKIEALEQVLIKDFHKVIRKSREKMNLTQEEVAKKLKEKVSVIKRIEEGWEPPLKLINKIEKFFNIKLKEEVEEKILEKKSDSRELTIGDVVEVG